AEGKTFRAGDIDHCTGGGIVRQNAAAPSAVRLASPSTAQGSNMSNRSWFYASNGQQQGPYPEAQLRDLVTRGMVGADTLVWTEGMSGWQRAGDIPGLVPGGSGPPSIPHPGGPAPVAAGGYAG